MDLMDEVHKRSIAILLGTLLIFLLIAWATADMVKTGLIQVILAWLGVWINANMIIFLLWRTMVFGEFITERQKEMETIPPPKHHCPRCKFKFNIVWVKDDKGAKGMRCPECGMTLLMRGLWHWGMVFPDKYAIELPKRRKWAPWLG